MPTFSSILQINRVTDLKNLNCLKNQLANWLSKRIEEMKEKVGLDKAGGVKGDKNTLVISLYLKWHRTWFISKSIYNYFFSPLIRKNL